MQQPPGQISADGLWRWDGQRWVPTGGVAQPPGPRRSLAWLWWLIGGCSVLLIAAIVFGGIGLFSAVKNFQSGGFSCLPSDFPVYPGASVTAENKSIGSQTICRMTYTSNDDVSTVTDWYSSHLGQGDWQDSADSGSGTISFQQVSGGHATGQVVLLGAGQHTEIQIRVNT